MERSIWLWDYVNYLWCVFVFAVNLWVALSLVCCFLSSHFPSFLRERTSRTDWSLRFGFGYSSDALLFVSSLARWGNRFQSRFFCFKLFSMEVVREPTHLFLFYFLIYTPFPRGISNHSRFQRKRPNITSELRKSYFLGRFKTASSFSKRWRVDRRLISKNTK